jgi:hypothetical protein
VKVDHCINQSVHDTFFDEGAEARFIVARSVLIQKYCISDKHSGQIDDLND